MECVLAEQTVHQHEQPDGVALDAFLIVQNIQVREKKKLLLTTMRCRGILLKLSLRGAAVERSEKFEF